MFGNTYIVHSYGHSGFLSLLKKTTEGNLPPENSDQKVTLILKSIKKECLPQQTFVNTFTIITARVTIQEKIPFGFQK